MEEQQNWQEQYNEYDGYNRDWPFTLEESHLESNNCNNTNDMPNLQVASNSFMEDAITHQ